MTSNLVLNPVLNLGPGAESVSESGSVWHLMLVSNVGTKHPAIRTDNGAKKLKEERGGQNGPNSFTCPKSKWSLKYTSKTDMIGHFGK